mgnify:CR=1 FL=1
MNRVSRVVLLVFLFSLLRGACAAAPETGRASGNPDVPDVVSRPLFVLYASPSSRRLLQGEEIDLRARVNVWRDLLRARGASYRILTHPDQWKAVPPGVAIVLPSAYVLDEPERRLLTERLAAGDSLLATGLPGSLDESGKFAGVEFASELFGPVTQPSENARDAQFLIVVGDTPLTYRLAAGSRLWIGKASLGDRVTFRQAGGGYVSDWSRRPGENGVFPFLADPKARRVLLGWTETLWSGKEGDLRTLAGAAVDWVEGRPVAYLATWPWPYRAAVTLGVDATWRFEHLPALAQLLQRHGAAASFHLLAADVEGQAALLTTLLAAGHDVASLGDRWHPFAGLSGDDQSRRVAFSARSLNKALGAGRAFAGLRAPEGATDVATEKAVIQHGGSYLVDVGRVESALPEFSTHGTLVLLPNTLNLEGGGATPATQARRWRESLQGELARTLTLGGYAYIGVDAAALVPGGPLYGAFAGFLSSARQMPALWLGKATTVARWWQERKRISLDSRVEGAYLVLTLNVDRGPPIDFPLALLIHPPPGKEHISLAEAMPEARLETAADGRQVLVLKGLREGQHRLRLCFSQR